MHLLCSANHNCRFVPGLITIEVVTLLFPLHQIYKHFQSARNYRKCPAEISGPTNAPFTAISNTSTARTTSSSRGKLYTMKELERCLANENDRRALQDFACKREFTGENVMFLTQVHDFRSHWYPLYNRGSNKSPAAKRRMFEVAVVIFAHLVCTDTASVYINIEGRIYKPLNAVLGDAARAHVSATRDSGSTVSPFGEDIMDAADTDEFGSSIGMSVVSQVHTDGCSRTSSTSKSMTAETISPVTSYSSREGLITPIEPFHHLVESTDNSVIDNFEIPHGFDHEIFNDAYESVKNMVYAQTWQRFNQDKEKGSLNSRTAI